VAHRRRKFRTQHGRRCSHSRGKANDLTEPTFIASLNGLSGFVLEVETAGVALTAMMSAFKRRHSAASAGHPFRLIAEALTGLRSRSCIIDGEAVACDDNGLASFERIRYRQHDGDVFLYAFDLIELNGEDLRRDPLQVRKATLASILAKARPGIRFNEHIEGDGPTIFAHACKMGLEDIVSKRKDSAYRCGRSRDWLKMRNPACAAVTREAEEDWAKGR
jgi:bifunctional non-homologous end joining protein LigD